MPLTLNCEYTLVFESKLTHESVILLSNTETNEIRRQSLSLSSNGETWWIQLDRATPQLYLFSVDGALVTDVTNPLSLMVNGQTWSYLAAQDCSRPQFTFVQREQRQARTFLTVQLQRASADSSLAPASVQATINGVAAETELIDDQVLIDITSLEFGKHTLTLKALDSEQRQSQPFVHPFWIDKEPFRWSDALLYQIVTDRFDGFEGAVEPAWTIGTHRGGTWAGIEDKLNTGYFDALGINALWISPINENPSGLWAGVEGGDAKYEGYHGYWRVSNTHINAEFGTPDTLSSMIKTAHTKGIRVIADVVLNHRHQDFNERGGGLIRANSACVCGRSICPWWSDIERCWFTSYLPDIDYGNAQSVHQELAALTNLLKRFDFDGIRVDAVPMMPRFVIRHLKAHMTSAFEGLDEAFILLGETFTDIEGHDNIRYYLGQHGLDGQFDFPLMWTLRQVFARQTGSTQDLINAWQKSVRAWHGSKSTMALMIGNHDVPRFTSIAADHDVYDPWRHPPQQVTAHGVLNRTLMAQAFLLALPGIWTLYYGDEVGMSGGNDPDNRRPLPKNEDIAASQSHLHAQLQRLGRTRRCLAQALHRHVEFESPSTSSIAVLRRDSKTLRPRLLVIIDRNSPMPSALLTIDAFETHEPWVDILSGEVFASSAGAININAGTSGTRWLLPVSDPCEDAGVW